MIANHSVLIRIMGESDIVDVNLIKTARNAEGSSALLAGLNRIVADNPLAAKIDTGANFVLLTLLREKWPVGSKSKFKVIADRVGADHTYLSHICGAVKLDNLEDHNALKREEAYQLSIALGFYKANRRRFANSSAVQGLIKA